MPMAFIASMSRASSRNRSLSVMMPESLPLESSTGTADTSLILIAGTR